MLNFLNFTIIFLNVKLIKIIFDLLINYKLLKSRLRDRKEMIATIIIVFLKIIAKFTNNHYKFTSFNIYVIKL